MEGSWGPGLGRRVWAMSVRDLDSDEGFGAAVTVPLQGLSEECQTPVFRRRVWFSAGELEPGRHFRGSHLPGKGTRLKLGVILVGRRELDRLGWWDGSGEQEPSGIPWDSCFPPWETEQMTAQSCNPDGPKSSRLQVIASLIVNQMTSAAVLDLGQMSRVFPVSPKVISLCVWKCVSVCVWVTVHTKSCSFCSLTTPNT